jgi:hypothetical protein
MNQKICQRFQWVIIAALISGYSGVAQGAAPAFDRRQWEDDFSDPARFSRDWTPYGFLAQGVDALHPLGKTVSGAQSRPEWWCLMEGALCARNFKEEKHPAGITHLVAGRDIRLSCRVRLPAGGMAQFTIRGDNPIVERNFHLAVCRVMTHGVAAADNDVIHPKDSAEGQAMRARGEWNRKFFIAKTESMEIAPDVWHEVAIELRGLEMTAYVGGKRVLNYITRCGDLEKTSIGLAGGSSRLEDQQTWFDDIRFEPLE